jgi:hypothetical protein
MLERSDSLKSNSKNFFIDYQLGAFLKKFPFKGTDTLTPAIRNFESAEEQCRLFNTENYRALLSMNKSHPDFLGVVEEIRDDVRELLGEFPPVNSIIDHAKHGPGVSLGDHYKDGCCTEYYKWSNLPYTVTQDALPYARTAIEADPRWMGALDQRYRHDKAIPLGSPICLDDFWSFVFQIVDGSRITSVPKTALTDRTIAIEPLMNVYFQLGVDHVLKVLLRKKWGYDLSSQTYNQLLALEGSIADLLATLDLKGASDTIALLCCKIVLPVAWFDLLLDLRSPQGVLVDKVYRFEKISSMGNGFTFALESLIFGALVRCAIRRTKSVRKSAVYGDDLIVPTTAAPYLVTLLNLFGFQLNKEKSFSSGPFRESCGKDFYLGYDVRPLFLKCQLASVRDIFYVHNSLLLLEERCHWTWEMDFSKTRLLLAKYLPTNIRKQFFGPRSESLDTHLFSDAPLTEDSETGSKVYWTIQARPKTFNPGTDFFFRKLMNQLKEIAQPWLASTPDRILNNLVINRLFGIEQERLAKWDRNRKLNTGNAFDVTKRGTVLLVSTRCLIVRTISPDLKSLATSRCRGLITPGNWNRANHPVLDS